MISGFPTIGYKVDPRSETTKEYYKSKGKQAKSTFVIGKRKDAELEDQNKWTDKVFTGDN